MGRRKQHSFEARFKEEAVRRMLNRESIMRLSREFDVARAVLYRWRDDLLGTNPCPRDRL